MFKPGVKPDIDTVNVSFSPYEVGQGPEHVLKQISVSSWLRRSRLTDQVLCPIVAYFRLVIIASPDV